LARELLEESLIRFQTLGDFKGASWVQFDLGMIEVNAGDFTTAREWLGKSLTLYQREGENGDKNGEGTVRTNLGFVLHRQHQSAAAWAHLNKAGDLLRGDLYLRRENYFRWYLHFVGRIKVDESHLAAAREHFRESLEIFRDREDKLGIIRSLLGFSWLAAKEDDIEKAITLLGAEDTLRSIKMGLPLPPDWKTETDFILKTAHNKLDETAFHAVWTGGARMTWDQAINYALG
jgi:tetratricopeptide (TPR) repeat protein